MPFSILPRLFSWGCVVCCLTFLTAAKAEIRFSNQASIAGVSDDGAVNGGVFGDYDGDGWPDLAVVRFTAGATTLLYRNGRDGTFSLEEDIWEAPRQSLGAIMVDFDLDGDLDIYTVHLRTDNQLWRNEGETFSQISLPDSLVGNVNGVAAVWVDFDGDGALDLMSVNRLGGRVSFLPAPIAMGPPTRAIWSVRYWPGWTVLWRPRLILTRTAMWMSMW